MNIWLKEIELEDGKDYCDLLIELAQYKDVHARPVPEDFTEDEFEGFKKNRIRMRENIDLPKNVTPTNTYWVMEDNHPIGYATLKHKANSNTIGGHFGLCLKKEYQNKGIGMVVSDLLSKIAYTELGIEEIIYTSKKENVQSQRSVEKIGGKLIDEHDGYFFYSVDIKNIYQKNK